MLSQKNLIAIAVIHVVVTFSAHALFRSSDNLKMSWEYKVHETKTVAEVISFYEITNRTRGPAFEEGLVKAVIQHESRLSKDLDKLGQDGWKIYSITENKRSFGTPKQVFYLKRPR